MSRAAAQKPSGRRKIILYATLAVILIAVVVAIGLASRNDAVPKAASNAPMDSKLKPGDTAPAFTAQTNAGPVDLAQVSTPVLLEVFATWCPHCQRETTVLNDLAKKYAGKLQIVAVSGSPYGIDGSSPESQSDVNQFGAQFAVRYPLAFDPDMHVAQLYLQGGFPTLVLIDRAKKVRWIKSGEVAEGDFVKAIDKSLDATI